MNISFFKIQPEIAHHGTGWQDEKIRARLANTNKDMKLHGAIYCVPARTYKAKHAPSTCPDSVNSWLKALDECLPSGAPIVICRTKLDLESNELKSDDLAFTQDQAKELVSKHERVCGFYDVSAKAGTGVEEWYPTVGALLVNNAPGGCVIM